MAYSGGVVVLVGMMGAGKTTIGRELAVLLNVDAVDNDDLIAARGGAGAAEILRTDAAKFRAFEVECIQDALSSGNSIVLSVGGGAVATPVTAQALKAHSPVVWLEVPEDELHARLQFESANRPSLDGDMKERLHSLLIARTPTYRQVADIVVDGVGTPLEVAKRIEVAL